MELLVNNFNPAPVSSFMGPTRGLILQLDDDRLTPVFAKIDLNLLPLRFLDVLAEHFLAVDQDDQLPVALGVIGDLQLESGFLSLRHVDFPG